MHPSKRFPISSVGVSTSKGVSLGRGHPLIVVVIRFSTFANAAQRHRAQTLDDPAPIMAYSLVRGAIKGAQASHRLILPRGLLNRLEVLVSSRRIEYQLVAKASCW